MKKVLLFAAIAIGVVASAQTEKGSWVISGKTGLGFSSVNTKYKAEGKSYDGPKVSSFTMEPSVGYFVANNLAIGADLSLTSTKTTYRAIDQSGDYSAKSSMFSIMPTATYYFTTGSNFRPYLGVGVGYGSVTSTESYDDKETTKGGLDWGVKGGFAYLLNSMVAIDLGVGYNDLTTKDTVDNTEIKTSASGFGVNAGISVFFK